LIYELDKMEIMKTSIRAILDNIESAEEFLDRESIDKFENVIINSKNIFVTGAGRSGLAAKAFAMRLMHLGLSAYVVGETISPAIYADDCIVAISGSGETNTIVSAANIAKNRGSKVLALTSYPESTLGQLADCFILVKGRTKKEVDDENYMKRQIHGNYTSLTPLGTAFELTTLVFLDAIVSELMEKMQQTESDLKARHTVLE
jgi:6-phospho-3-hexuloisomerase